MLDRAEIRAVLGDLSRRFLAFRPSSISHPSLASGHAGVALVHAALDRVFPGDGHASRAQRVLERAIVGLATTSLSPSLYGGFTGVAWVTELLRGDPSAPPKQDANSQIDRVLEKYLSRSPWDEPYDLIQGLVGLGVYALERMPRPSAHRLLALILDRLAETARRKAPGVAWWSDPEWTAPRFRRTPHWEWNLGVAHGVPGVIALLGRIVAAPVDERMQTRARALLDKAVAWLLAQQLPRGSEGSFATAVGPGMAAEPTRLAWCYGDPGVASTLLLAARAAGVPAWERAALRIALRAAARPDATAGVIDAGLCHGAAGLAHIFHRLYRATGEVRLAQAARCWFARTLAMRHSRRGFGGFPAGILNAQGKVGWHADPGFLTGTAGVTLALAAAVSDDEPVWDRALLLS